MRSGLSSSDPLLSGSAAYRPRPRPPRVDLRASGSERENASPRLAFNGPSIESILRRRVMAAAGRSEFSLGSKCVVQRGCTSNALTSSI